MCIPYSRFCAALHHHYITASRARKWLQQYLITKNTRIWKNNLTHQYAQWLGNAMITRHRSTVDVAIGTLIKKCIHLDSLVCTLLSHVFITRQPLLYPRCGKCLPPNVPKQANEFCRNILPSINGSTKIATIVSFCCCRYVFLSWSHWLPRIAWLANGPNLLLVEKTRHWTSVLVSQVHLECRNEYRKRKQFIVVVVVIYYSECDVHCNNHSHGFLIFFVCFTKKVMRDGIQAW